MGFLSPLMTGATLGRGPGSQQQTSDDAQAQLLPGANAWRSIPKELPPGPANDKEKQILEDRGAFFDAGNPYVEPLDQPTPGIGQGYALCSGPIDLEAPEIPFVPDEAVVVANFERYQPYLTPSHRYIYTKIILTLQQVLESGPSSVQPGQEIDLLIHGGTVMLNDGRVISFLIRHEDVDFSLQPDHRYILFLQNHRKGDFFTLERSWELKNGIALPYSAVDAKRMKEGTSQLAGLAESDFLEAVRKAIEHDNQEAFKN